MCSWVDARNLLGYESSLTGREENGTATKIQSLKWEEDRESSIHADTQSQVCRVSRHESLRAITKMR